MKYSEYEVALILEGCIAFTESRLTMETLTALVRKEVPGYPIKNLLGEARRVAEYLEGRGRYGRALPANWAKMFLKLTKGNRKVVAALGQQQDLYERRDGKRNRKLDLLLEQYVE